MSRDVPTPAGLSEHHRYCAENYNQTGVDEVVCKKCWTKWPCEISTLQAQVTQLERDLAVAKALLVLVHDYHQDLHVSWELKTRLSHKIREFVGPITDADLAAAQATLAQGKGEG